MKKLFKVVWQKFCNLFKKKPTPLFDSARQEHWINHIHDETKLWPDGHLHWANIHGFDEGPGAVYWVGVDFRYMGIRIEDYVIKCKNKSTYDEYVNLCPEDFLKKMNSDSRMIVRGGGDVGVEFVFRWGGEDKCFDVHLAGDRYAEEK
jgi:hypothetical protein